MGTDLKLQLEKGENIVYLTSAAESEDRLKASDLENRYYQNVNVGFIVYHEAEDTLKPLSFSKAVLTYKLHKNLTDCSFRPVDNVGAGNNCFSFQDEEACSGGRE